MSCEAAINNGSILKLIASLVFQMLHVVRILLTGLATMGFFGMVISMKVLKNKASSSTFELIMAASFMAYIGSFANQLSHVEISISAKVEEDESGDVGFFTELEIDEEDWDRDDVAGGDDGEEGRRSRTFTITKMSRIPTPLGRVRASSWG